MFDSTDTRWDLDLAHLSLNYGYTRSLYFIVPFGHAPSIGALQQIKGEIRSRAYPGVITTTPCLAAC